jgi:hypothetical protein
MARVKRLVEDHTTMDPPIRGEVITCPLCNVNLTGACTIFGKVQAMDIHQLAHEREILRSLLGILKDRSNPEVTELASDIDRLSQWRQHHLAHRCLGS